MIRLKRYKDNPVLSPLAGSSWQSLAVTNPGVWHDPETGEVSMLYRAAGDDPEHRIYLGLARSANGFHFERVSNEPVLTPSADGFDAGCVEDPRIVKIDDWFYVTYACRPFPPGQYWLEEAERRYSPPEVPEDFPWNLRENATATGLALTRDFKTWIRAGRMTNPTADDRDVYLFPEKIGGSYFMIHRPMNRTGPRYGTDFPAYELEGFYPGVCFPCGKSIRDGVLFVYYGGADRYVCLATIELDALLGELTRHPVS